MTIHVGVESDELERVVELLGADASHVFSHTDTCLVLSLVNGSRFQPLQRSRSDIPASRAIRSSSAGDTERNGIEKPFPASIDEVEVVRDEALRVEVELVDADVCVAQVEDLRVVACSGRRPR